MAARTAISWPWVSACGLPLLDSARFGVPTISPLSSGTAWVHRRLPSFRSPPGCRPAAANCLLRKAMVFSSPAVAGERPS